MKYLGGNLTKYAQDVYKENHKTVMKGIKEELNKWRDISCLWIEKLSIATKPALLSLIYTFNTTPIQYQEGSYFVDMDTQNNQHDTEAEGQSWRTDTYYKDTVIKSVWSWQNNRQIDQWNKIESPAVDPHRYNQLIIGKGEKLVQ